MAEQKPRLSNHRVIKVAAAAIADPRTVRRVLQGGRVRGDVDGRVRDVLKSMSIAVPPPDDEGDDE
jgi:hypothetical protein